MEYRSQKIAYWYFVVALLLFALQVVMGLWLAFSYSFTVPQKHRGRIPLCNSTRHAYEPARALDAARVHGGNVLHRTGGNKERDLFSEARLVPAHRLVTTGVVALVGFIFGWTQGSPLLEIPTTLDFVVVAGALVFLFNVGMTMYMAKRWTVIQGTLLGGLLFLALLYLFGIPFYRNEVIDWYYWWWVIHLWVEGAWELVTASIFAFVLMKLTGVDRQVVEKWLYVEIGLFLFTGIVGTGHHYYWIGAPRYWLWFGGIFSALEPLPILLMLIDTMNHVKQRKTEDNQSAHLDHRRRLRGDAYDRRRGMGFHAHAPSDQLLYPRIAGYGVARAPRVFRGLCAPQHHGLLLRHAEDQGDRGVRCRRAARRRSGPCPPP